MDYLNHNNNDVNPHRDCIDSRLDVPDWVEQLNQLNSDTSFKSESDWQQGGQLERWYDDDFYLTAVLSCLETMSTEVVDMVANTAVYFVEQAIVAPEDRMRYRAVHALLQASNMTARRWADRSPTLAVALEMLQALPKEKGEDISHQLFVPVHILYGYEQYCAEEAKTMMLSEVQSILELSIHQGAEATIDKYGFYMDAIADKEHLEERTEQVQLVEPSLEKAPRHIGPIHG